ncbi:MAG: ABC transporter permease [Planctomycetes bacterium]|nr:ABC transporter permease [Planctomycetota bacterium]
MRLSLVVGASLASLRANKLRSSLAMLGIIIGVAAVVSMVAIGAGAQAQVLERITAMGTDLLIIRPGQRGTGGVMSGTQQNLTLEDARALLDLPRVRQVTPVVQGMGQVKFLGRNTRVQVQGVALPYLPMRGFEVERGSAFSEAQVESSARVAVLGPVTAENLFGGAEPVGALVKVNGIGFTVVGVLKAKGDQGWFNPDDQVLVPYTVAMKQLFGLTRLREIDVQGAEGADLTQVQADVTRLLRRRHRQAEGSGDDFTIRNQAEMIETMSRVTRTFTLLLGSIAGISLLVGGIGIMNIMLVTVTERTREIGVRKAIGARNRDILRQFLVEAVVVSLLGGLVGAALGSATAWLISALGAFPARIEPTGVVLALGFSAAVGVFFGWYPARRAARLDPIEALRYE